MNYKKETKIDFENILNNLELKAQENGFRVLHVHNVKNTLKDKGFEIDNYSIVELCNAGFANKVLNFNKDYGVMLPCKVIVYSENGKNFVTMPLPGKLIDIFNMPELQEIAGEVERILIKIIEESLK